MSDDNRKIRRALISVFDKTGIVEFARALHEEFGIEIISTGGTSKTLQDAGIPVTLIESVTGFPEMLDGRVKTLHPAIHAAILADRNNPEHMHQLEAAGIKPIDMVVVNLYPFETTVADPNCTFEQAIEMIDIGGVTLLRAAAKNHRHVLTLVTPSMYGHTIHVLRGDSTWDDRPTLSSNAAFEALWRTAGYDSRIAVWLSHQPENSFQAVSVIRLNEWGELRYGENPHQGAQLTSPDERGKGYRLPFAAESRDDQLRLSFNNYLDADAALGLCAELTRAEIQGTAKLCFASESGNAKLRFAPVADEERTRRNLPHWQLAGATYWITYSSRIGVLSPEERDIAFDALRFWDGKKLDLHLGVVMPTHVHALLTPRQRADKVGAYENLSELLKSIKGYSGRLISKHRGDIGEAWIHESFDRWIRSEEDFHEKWLYAADNIVKEGLAPAPDSYRWWFGIDFFGRGWGRPLGPDTPIPPVLGGPVRTTDLEPRPFADSENKAELGSSHSIESKAELCSPRACVFIKHTNPCGAAVADEPIEAYRRAYLADPNAAMGGILACNFEVDAAFATAVMETYERFGKPLKDAGAAHAPGGFFVEVWIAPKFEDEAVEIIRGTAAPSPDRPNPPKKKWGENVRLLSVGDMSRPPDPSELLYRSIAGGMLVQTPDLPGLNEEQWQIVTKRPPTDQEAADLRLAWLICKHTKSNAISIVKDGTLIGNGAGQMSRVMSCRIAAWLARENGHADRLAGSVAASDAFFPFSDGPALLIDAGVTAIIQPGGSKRDAEVVAACDEKGVAMVFTGTRHFRH